MPCTCATLLQAYGNFNEKDNININTFFALNQDTRTRSNGIKIYKRQCRTKVIANSFYMPATNPWNQLPEETKPTPTLNPQLRKYSEKSVALPPTPS